MAKDERKNEEESFPETLPAPTDDLPPLHEASTQVERTGDTPTDDPAAKHGLNRQGAPPAFPEGYEFIKPLGEGGMGEVYLARHLKLKRLVAIKMLREMRGGNSALARFQREAEAVARLQHPNIVQVFEVGEVEGAPFFALEYIQGGDLIRWTKGEQVAPQLAAQIVIAIAEGIEHAHQKGIIHRDLKPANVLMAAVGPVDEKGDGKRGDSLRSMAIPKVTDFGLAKDLSNSAGGQTQIGAVMGTPSFMASEQAAGENDKIGPATDVYALGAVLYWLLTGKAPHVGENNFETLKKVRSDEPVSPRKLNSSVSLDLETITQKCLRKIPSERYESAAELAEDLQRYLQDEPIQARPLSFPTRMLRRAKRYPAAALSALLLMVIVFMTTIGGILWANRGAFLPETPEVVSYYSGFNKRNGVPFGVGELTEKQVRKRRWSLRFHSKNDRLLRIDVINGRGTPTSNSGIGRWIEDPGNKRPITETSYHFFYDNSGKLVREEGRNPSEEVVYTMKYDSPTLVHYVDEKGQSTPQAGSNAVFVELARNGKGYVKKVQYLNAQKRPTPSTVGAYSMEWLYDKNGRAIETRKLNENGELLDSTTEPAIVAVRFNAKGWADEIRLYDKDRQPFARQSSAHLTTKTYDNAGNLTGAALYDENRQPVINDLGYHRYAVTLDDQGAPTEIRYFGADNKPAEIFGRVHRTKWLIDDAGRTVGREFYDIAGKPVLHEQLGFFREEKKLDKNGLPTETRFFGIDGKPIRAVCEFTTGPAALAKTSFDRFGNVQKIAYFDEKDQALTIDGSVHQHVFTYAATGFRSMECFGANRKRVINAQGFSKIERKYNDSGELIGESYFGVDDLPIVIPQGYSSWKAGKSEMSNRVGESIEYYGIGGDEDPVQITAGFHEARTITNKFNIDNTILNHKIPGGLYRGWPKDLNDVLDSKQNILKATSYFDPAMRQVAQTGGVFNELNIFDGKGRKLETTWLGADTKPTPNPQNGLARISWRYKPNGELIEKREFCAGRLSQYIQAKRIFDENGNSIEESYFTLQDETQLQFPARRGDGGFRTKNSYDERGNLTDIRLYDEHNKPMINHSGYHHLKNEFDAASNLTSTRYFGAKEEPINHWEYRYHSYEIKYDNLGRMIEAVTRDKNNMPVAYRPANSTFAWARATTEFDSQGAPRMRTWDVAESGDWIEIEVFQSSPQQAHLRYWTEDRQPALHADGYHSVLFSLNRQGYESRRQFLDTDYKPTRTKSGVLEWSSNYPANVFCDRVAIDGKGQVVERWTLGFSYLPMYDSNGLHNQRNEYDEQGNLARESYFDIYGRPFTNPQGFHSKRMKYDEFNRLIERVYYDVSNNPVAPRDEYPKTTFFYKEKPTGEPKAPPGTPEWFATPGSDADKTTDWALDENGNFIEVNVRLDDKQNRVEEWFTTADGEPIASAEGYHRVKREFSKTLRITKEAFFGADNEPVNCSLKYATRQNYYDDTGRLAKVELANADGQPVKLQVVVHRVEPNTPAEKAGVQVGDEIVSVDRRRAVTAYSFYRLYLAGFQNKTRTVLNEDPQFFELKIRRNGQLRSFSLPTNQYLGFDVIDQVQ